MPQWSLLIRQARRARLLARLADHALKSPHAPPRPVVPHLTAARNVAANHHRSLLWEVHCVSRLLEPLDVPIILLKGAAYAALGLDFARQRITSDLDIMVPEEALDDVHRCLLKHDWHPLKLDVYDERYYRLWMHELPPLRHAERQTVIDVHHTILPRTARIHPDPQELWRQSRPLPPLSATSFMAGRGRLRILSPTDMLLHASAHLFHDGEIAISIRDLVDIDDLCCCFGAEPGFWDGLVGRATELDLARPLYFSLRYCDALLGSRAIPPTVLEAAASAGAPSRAWRAAMDRLVPAALLPDHPDRPGAWHRLAALILYIRSHWLRMPAGLLARHLTRKAAARLHILPPTLAKDMTP